MSRRTRLVLLDLDNTLYDWVGFFVPSLRAMVGELSAALDRSDDALLGELREVYAKHGSLEYAFCVQAMPSVRRLPLDARRELIARARRAFVNARSRRLVPYSGVAETLRVLRSARISLVATTNAPLYQAMHRLEQLGIAQCFDAVAARRSFPIPADGFVSEQLRRNGDVPHRATVARTWKLPAEDLKPSPRMYRLILEATETDPAAALAVGDSIAKDIAPALRLGARGAWARYGQDVDAEMWSTLLSVTPWEAKAVAEHARETETPTHRLEAFPELLDVV